ncbi:MAG: hypothetical protein HYX75_15960 [Acidobacteria bacterium]|nr:hypothetical protein [Acidobacteriota bacterium]
MNKIKLSTGYEVNLDGDLLALIEAIYEEIALKKELKHTYEDVMGEIENILRQISVEDLRLYFRESLFLNTVTYENEMLNAYIKRLAGKADEP